MWFNSGFKGLMQVVPKLPKGIAFNNCGTSKGYSAVNKHDRLLRVDDINKQKIIKPFVMCYINTHTHTHTSCSNLHLNVLGTDEWRSWTTDEISQHLPTSVTWKGRGGQKPPIFFLLKTSFLATKLKREKYKNWGDSRWKGCVCTSRTGSNQFSPIPNLTIS